MIGIEIPGRGAIELRHLLLDVNGTIATDGQLLPGIAEAIAALATSLSVSAVTADTRGTASILREQLAVDVRVIQPGDEGDQKAALVESIGARGVVAMGNGANDAGMLRAAAVGIAVIGREGASASALTAADIVVTDVLDGFGLLADPHRLVATLRL